VLFHQLGQHLILLLQLGLEEGNALLAGLHLFVGPGRRSEGRGPVLKELLQPAVEDRGVDVMFVAQSGNRNPIDQVPAENGHLLLGGVMLAFVAHEPSPL
jgi:hypothetical protein